MVRLRHTAFLLCTLCLACGDDSDPRDLGPAPDIGAADGGSSDLGMIGRDGGDEDMSTVDACVELTTTLEPAHQPIDVVLVVDNTLEMEAALTAIEETLYSNFAAILEGGGVDLQLIVLSDHGAGDLELCVPEPLSGPTDCTMDAGDEAGRFHHYDIQIDDTNAPCLVLDTYRGSAAGGEAAEDGAHPNGWGQYLRADALKAFVVATGGKMQCSWAMPGNLVEVSDCDPLLDSECFNDMESTDPSAATSPAAAAAANFQDQLAAIDAVQFDADGDETSTVWYTLTDLTAKAEPDELYGAEEPLVTTLCRDPGTLGTGFQWLSTSEGQRGPICETGRFASYFSDIAADLDRRTVRPCQFPLGEGIDPIDLSLSVAPSGGSPRSLRMIDEAGTCGLADDAFYVDGAAVGLCPEACDLLRADTDPVVELTQTCD